MRILLVISIIWFSLFGLFGISTSYAKDTVDIEFERSYGSSENDKGVFAEQTDDGGYIVVGETSSGYLHGSGEEDVYLLKINSAGLFKWKKTYGDVRNDSGAFVQQTEDGGFIITGETNSYTSSADKKLYLIKTDSNGTKKWHKTFGDSGEDSGVCVQQTKDNGYIVVGNTTSFSNNNNSDIYLVKTNAKGKMQWEKSFGGKQNETATFVRQTEDGGYIAVGKSSSFGSGIDNVFMIKTDKLGNKEWTRTYGNEWYSEANYIEKTKEGGFILAGNTSANNPTGSSAYLIKTDNNGIKQWKKTFNGNGWAVAKSVQQTEDNGYLLAGWTIAEEKSGFKLFLVKTDGMGNKIWSKNLYGDKFNSDFQIVQSNDGSYLVTGWWTDLLKWSKTRNDRMEIYLMKVK